ncbi:YqaJ viral recombinase family protein [Nocardia cyriacigeorgica]|uniref:YqaJ viral recombinase family nuclease n=1 Tax=Nocardia cyriacigeorgica TaxID=135487 RepID=UPI0018962763|nr:YqaJ viral recombinase family protein [Nocardia cyriacigeorgica]MBF6326465.1 YqaJ viral recombinase family protein [Nocardia cyriacigeorgica]
MNTIYRELPRTEHGSPEWLEARLAGIGSSEISGLLGMTDWDSEWSIWLRKTRRVPADTGIDTEAMFWGRELEPAIRRVASARLGIEFDVPGTLQSIERPYMLYSPDGVSAKGDAILECKNTAWFMASRWEGQIPDHAELQMQHGMYVTGATHGYAAGLIGGNRLEIQRVDRDERVIGLILAKADPFWHDYVEADREPPIGGTRADRDAVTHLHPHVGGDLHVTRQQIATLHAEYRAAREAEAAAKKRKNAAGNSILRLMDGHSRLLVGDDPWVALKGGPFRSAEFRENEPDLYAEYLTRAALDTVALREEHPDVYAKYQSHSLDLKEVA